MVRTDPDDLRWLLYLTESTGRLTRWLLHLSEFDFASVYKTSRVDQVTDELSPLPSTRVRKGRPLLVEEEILLLVIPTLVHPTSPVTSHKTATRSRELTLKRTDSEEDIDLLYSDVRIVRSTPGRESLSETVNLQ